MSKQFVLQQIILKAVFTSLNAFFFFKERAAVGVGEVAQADINLEQWTGGLGGAWPQ